MNIRGYYQIGILALLMQVYSLTANAMDPMPKSETTIVLNAQQAELYQEALNFRNGKVLGFSPEESREQAKIKFSELARLGYPNAMHNLACILHTRENYQEAYHWFSEAAKKGFEPSQRNCEIMEKEGKVKKDLFLIVGSTRNVEGSFGPIIDMIMGNNQSTMSHLDSYNGQAITMDLDPAEQAHSRHIQGDARTYDFTKGYKIKAAYLERLPTLDDNFEERLATLEKAGYMRINNIGLCIQNIANAMNEGAILEIEWSPYITLLNYPKSKIDQLIESNPFHGFMDMNIALHGFFRAAGDRDNMDTLPKDFLQLSLAQGEKVNKLLEYYCQHGLDIPMEILHTRIYKEALTYQGMVMKDLPMILQAGPNAGIEEFDRAYKTKQFIRQEAYQLVGKKIEYDKALWSVYSASSFMTRSFINFILADLAIETNSPYVIDYMHSIGFKDVSIERTQSPHNKRKNVWIIRGIKSNK